jgi:YgiT-type zinc finger domain-containing protein
MCTYCGSETVEGLTKSAFWVEGELIAVEGIAARVCSHCGERFYDEETAGKIAAIGKGERIDGLTKREILVPIVSAVYSGRVQAAAC